MSEMRPEPRRTPRNGSPASNGAGGGPDGATGYGGADPHLPAPAPNGYDGPYGARVVVDPSRGGYGPSYAPGYGQPQQPEPEAPQMDVPAVLWRRRWIILGAGLIGLAVGFFLYQRATPLYQSVAQIYVQQNGPRVMGDSGLSGGSANYLNTQAELIRSTTVLNASVNRPGISALKTFDGVDNKVGLLSTMLTVDLGDNNDIMSVGVTAPDAQDAAQLANAVVEAYTDFTSSGKKKTADTVLAALQSARDVTTRRLEDLHAQKIAFSREHGLLVYDTGTGRSGNIVTAKLAELSGALTAAQLQTVEAKLRNEMLDAAGTDEAAQRQVLQMIAASAGPNGGPAGGSGNADLWSQVRQLKLDLRTMQFKYGEDYPDVVDLKRKIPLLEGEIKDLDAGDLQSQVAAIRTRYKAAQLKEGELQKAYDTQREQALDVNATSAEFDKLESDINGDEGFLASINEQIKRINVNEDAGGPSVTSIETARVAGVPVSPKLNKNLGGGLVGGLMLGLGLALLLDVADPRLRGIDEIGRLLELPVVGVIPKMKGKRSPSDRGLTVQHQPRGEAAEAYRNVRTVVFFELPTDPLAAPANGGNGGNGANGNGNGHHGLEGRELGRPAGARARTLLITSPTPGDGKTTMAANLSVAMAQSGRRVLLVDADCRRPTVHKIFEVADEVGLSTLIADDADPAVAVVASIAPNLDLLPCGPVPSNPSEMLNSGAFADLLDELARDYDMIVIDAPPVLPVADARILSARVDATLLVLRANKSSRKTAQHARDSLARVGGRVLGVAVNDVEIKKRRFGGYSEGYGYGGYGYAAHGYHDEGRADAAPGGSGAAPPPKPRRRPPKPAQPALPADEA